jgi:hypothetical protein
VDHLGNVHLVWEDYVPTGSSIGWAVLDRGETTWRGFLPVNEVQPPDVDPPRNPDVAVDKLGVSRVVWQDFRSGNEDPDIFISRLSPGEPQWSADERVNQDDAGNPQGQPAIATKADGTTIVVWTDGRNSAGGTDDPDIYFALFKAWDMQWTDESRVNDDSQDVPVIQSDPDVAMDDKGAAYVVWTDHRNVETAPDIYSTSMRIARRSIVYLPVTLR